MRNKEIEGQAMLPPQSLKAQKGRGAVTNMQGRYEVHARETFDDGWEQEEDAPKVWRTHVSEETARTILSRNQSPDIPFNVSLNPYRGCEHGCIYCFARPSHSYLGLSPGLDFESRLFAKVNAPELLRSELAKPSYVADPIALGVNTDAYQPCERDYKLTRRVLEVLQECEHPVGLITKSALIERDIDILGAMAQKNLAAASITITTLDPKIARTLEPRAAAPARRLRTIKTLSEAGIPVGVSIAPIIPFVTEPDIERVLEAARDAGAIMGSYIVLRLPWEVNPLFQQWLEAHFPDRAQRVMNRIRDMHGGKDYDANFATRMKGEGVWADLIHQRIEKTLARLGMIGRGMRYKQLDRTLFKRPQQIPASGAKARAALAAGQMDLFQ
ncbi:PA0069 family radical SAM protein [Massilia sp. YIM B04103]|uniref:PA0069 family radical SAM protein n=1 Tax=Massilia sp. YIM B04103 TaxID=2963106 RepID=UPI00210C9875|nr:PA0069 family radical SAM protein [Massilia sp. YIM B04103]